MGLEEYRKLEIDRKDMSILNEDISKEVDPFIRLKKYIIVLRRNNNAVTYKEFKEFYLDNEVIFLNSLEARELISICDTIADFDEGIDCGIALSLSTLINSEKFFLTFDHITKESKHFKSKGNVWGIRLACDDAPLNFIYRMDNLTKKVPYLNRIFRMLLKNSIEDKNSSIRHIIKHSKNGYIYSDCINKIIRGKDISDEVHNLRYISMQYAKK